MALFACLFWAGRTDAAGPYESVSGDVYTLAFPAKEISAGQADALLANLEGGGWMNEKQLRELLPQLLLKQGVEPGRIVDVGAGTDRFFILCSQCEDFCRGRCIAHPSGNWGNHCFCWEPPSDERRGIILLLLVDPKDEAEAVVAAVGSVACLPPPPGMVLWMSGDLETADLSGLGNDGIWQPSAAVAAFTPGKVSQAFDFTGPNRVEVADDPTLQFASGSISIDTWVRLGAGHQAAFIAHKIDPASGTGFAFVLSNTPSGKFLSFEFGGVIAAVSNPTPIVVGQWHHVAAVLDRASATPTLKFYVDGNQVVNFTNPPGVSLSSAVDLLVGPPLGANVAQISIDELEIFNRALAGSEVLAIFEAGRMGKCKCEPLPNGLACTQFCALGPDRFCLPTEVTCLAGSCLITDCDCLLIDQCHAEFPLPPSGDICFGLCPDSQETCQSTTRTETDGSTVHRCGCISCASELEACCLGGECQMLHPQCCLADGGNPQGAGTACTAPEACCHRGGACQMLDPLCCTAAGGFPRGPGTACLGIEACCLSDGSCQNLDAQCCADDGIALGAESACEGDGNGDGRDEACCEGAPGDLLINLTTGVFDAGGPISVGAFDDTWTVTCDASGNPVPRSAAVIGGLPVWADVPPAQWISADVTGPNGDYCYESCFCLGEGFQNPLLNFSILADDNADVFLNNSSGSHLLVSTPTLGFQLPAATFTSTPDTPFEIGDNCIEVVVHNTQGFLTGFAMTGQFSAETAVCCCDPLPMGLGCQNVTCPDERERCLPTLASYDPCEGGSTTLECACGPANRCRLIPGRSFEGGPEAPPECAGQCPLFDFCTLLAGDSDGDGILEYSCACSPPTKGRSIGDVDGDGDVDLFDYALLQNGLTGPNDP